MKHVLLAILLMAPGLVARAQEAPSMLVNAIAVIVNDKVITSKDVYMITKDEEAFLNRRYGGQPQVLKEKVNALRAERLEELIEHNLVLHEFAGLGRPLPESYVENRINEDIKKYGDRLTFTKTLQSQGMTFESYREKMREKTILDLMWGAKVPRDPVISPTKIENFYQANKEKFHVDDQVKLRMIVLTNRVNDASYSPVKLANEIAKKLDEGGSFAEMARIYSQGSQASEGGDWGEVDKKVLREDLAKVAFSLKPGQRSEVLETPSGVYLMLVEKSTPAHIRPLSEVREEVEQTLKAEESKRLRRLFVERLKKKSFVRYF
jgi:peptidyl-prolyl cis-trans isomerase SurA